MRSQRPRPGSGGRIARGFVASAAVLAVSGCSALGFSDNGEAGPPRISPEPRPDVAAAMVEGRPDPDARLNACELLDLTTAELIELTDADMPEVEPIGSGDLGLMCTYGGPGSPELYEMQQAEAESDADADADADDEDETDADAGAETEADAEAGDESEAVPGADATTPEVKPMPTTSPTTTRPSAGERDEIPDTVAAGVVKPRGGPQAALRGQPAMLGVRYACSEIRGGDAASIDGAPPAAPEAPAPVDPELDTAYIDCAAAPTGGGVEVHTILIADNDLWHVTLISPETPRSPDAEARALEGLHRIAEHILA
ncbi:hypothetical protein G6027_13460 [Dietzia sp. SLG310A2-38A2]|uniref:hypothetical protein n=1 Tax=Dietzia sp. SLG310A2-38A2 TaxID=1630643 RepID=UPI0015FD3A70|nr:hypothetical protein [Dietzia sp. SLG310A2-38A2]MBB1031871.1 hypothetical protein [Dietzia sp. SLG310A2-38A2]